MRAASVKGEAEEATSAFAGETSGPPAGAAVSLIAFEGVLASAPSVVTIILR